MQRKRLVCLAVTACLILSFLAAIPNVKADVPWLDNYQNRAIFYLQTGEPLNESLGVQAKFTVVNGTGYNQDNTFYRYNETRSDFHDLRVTLNDGETLLPIWNQTTYAGENCTVWVLFPVVNASYFLYWGNPNAETVWNQSAVFQSVISNVTGAWIMNEADASTPVIDYSGNNNNGTATDTAVSLLTPKFTGMPYRVFNGTTSYVSFPVGFNNDSFTIFGWFNWDGTFQDGSDAYIFESQNYAVRLKILADNTLGVYIAYPDTGTPFVIGPVVSSGVWHFWAVSYVRNTSLSVTLDSTTANTNLGDPFQDSNLALNTWFNAGWFRGSDTAIRHFKGNMSGLLMVSSDLTAQFDILRNSFPDPSLDDSVICVRNYVYPEPIILFGSVEAAPSPTPNPDDLTADDAFAVAVAFGLIAVGVSSGLIFFIRNRDS